MDAHTTIDSFLKGLLTTNILSLTDFQNLIKNDHRFNQLSDDSIEKFYNLYKAKDITYGNDLRRNINQLVEPLRETNLEDLKQNQSNSSYSLEDMIIGLYKVGALLETRTNVINGRIEEEIEVLKGFYKVAGVDSNSIPSNRNILQMLENYRCILEELDDKDTQQQVD
ncbi:similar to Saccharomyces cerevisiae YLR315W NKP2 Non-essential kinetochore protein [Maudiozyma saulgeensis]|uniref:Similar to Saccharomyces cerevisiae YLR315W NKP2 Non-essential kinetochore protein n=1 Tax=Maudiozyma saulgeensis TaxID=1789683 RepID=A0A1X7R9F7_9SACH|nr:similar to Saccharomyces cerevisiae YLR315W NKP2 Non-essential kinetochore protein [Kazachstania saulgeensis]